MGKSVRAAGGGAKAQRGAMLSGMMRCFALAALLLCGMGVEGAGLRYRIVAEAENVPPSRELLEALDSVQGEVLAREDGILLRSAKRSTVARKGKDGKVEIREIDHLAKTYKAGAQTETARKMQETTSSLQGMQALQGMRLRVNVEDKLPERQIEGRRAVGQKIEIGFALGAAEEKKESQPQEGGVDFRKALASMLGNISIQMETWKSKDMASPWTEQVSQGIRVGARGVYVFGDSQAGESMLAGVRSLIEMAEGGKEQFEKLIRAGKEDENGFVWETVITMLTPGLAAPGTSNPGQLRMRIFVKDFAQAEVNEKEFEIPEGYRRLE